MIVKLYSWWQRIKQHPVSSAVFIGASLLGIALLVAFIGGYFFNWDWTGFSSYTPPVKDSNFQRGKTLWDWLNLLGVLAIPAVVGLGAAWYTAQQGKASERENKDNQREAALQAYIDKISELLIANKLHESAKAEQARKVARVRTLTVLQRLDAERKVYVLQFLGEAGLINRDKPIVELKGADFSGIIIRSSRFSGPWFMVGADLSGANFSNTVLPYIFLTDAKLQLTDFRGADLSGAWLVKADLLQAKLQGANLRGAELSGAELSGVNFSGVDLTWANLSGTGLGPILSEDQTKSLRGKPEDDFAPTL